MTDRHYFRQINPHQVISKANERVIITFRIACMHTMIERRASFRIADDIPICLPYGNLVGDIKDNDRLADDHRINAGDIRINLTVDLLLAYRPTC